MIETYKRFPLRRVGCHSSHRLPWRRFNLGGALENNVRGGTGFTEACLRSSVVSTKMRGLGRTASIEVVEDLCQARYASVAVTGKGLVAIDEKRGEPGVFGATIVLER
jgi:hypothetical protein